MKSAIEVGRVLRVEYDEDFWTIDHSGVHGISGPVTVILGASVLDGWHVEVVISPGETEPRVKEIRIFPEDASAPEPGTQLLRKLGLGNLLDDFMRHLREDPITPFLLGDEWTRPVKRPGRAGRDLRHYLSWARRYVEARERDPDHPVREIIRAGTEEGEYLTPGQVLGNVNRARVKGLLTSAPRGKAGGQLTPKAKAMIRKEQEVLRAINKEKS